MIDGTWLYEGRCHKFGDDVRHDGYLMPQQYVTDKVFDPQVLKSHLLEDDRPDFRAAVAPGDILLAGRNFGKGKAHVQGYIALRAFGVGVLCESMPYLSFRGAISVGLVFMAECAGISAMASDGDRLRVNFETGRFENLTTGVTRDFPPLPEELRRIVAKGGATEMLRQWWEEERARAVA